MALVMIGVYVISVVSYERKNIGDSSWCSSDEIGALSLFLGGAICF